MCDRLWLRNLARIRQDQGLVLEELALRCHPRIAASTIRALEHGRPPRRATAENLATTLGVSVLELYGLAVIASQNGSPL
jgi:transcriptional regulator with XRE-family HTH domain